MFNAAASTVLYTYFENSVGRLLEHPMGKYISVEYNEGPRKPSELQAFLTEAGQFLAARGWDKLLGDQTLMAPFTPEETEWITEHWHSKKSKRTDLLYGAMLLPHDVFAQLSWKAH
jgi:hypothetical protein